jgi:hypothetical protein
MSPGLIAGIVIIIVAGLAIPTALWFCYLVNR